MPTLTRMPTNTHDHNLHNAPWQIQNEDLHNSEVEKYSNSAKDLTLNKIAGANFHNRSQFDFNKLIADSNHIAANLRNHINGYSAREIIEYFNFDDQIERLIVICI